MLDNVPLGFHGSRCRWALRKFRPSQVEVRFSQANNLVGLAPREKKSKYGCGRGSSRRDNLNKLPDFCPRH